MLYSPEIPGGKMPDIPKNQGLITIEGAKMSKAVVGKPAPDFTAQAYIDGAFTQVSLSDYQGKWVVLFFYPGDFTFV